MRIRRLRLQNWTNFRSVDVMLPSRAFLVGPNASGKSNLLDAVRFLGDLARPGGGGLQAAVANERRQGLDPGQAVLPFIAPPGLGQRELPFPA